MDRLQRERLKQLKMAANNAKSDLMRLADQIEEVSPRQAEQLNKIIWKLESWQNR